MLDRLNGFLDLQLLHAGGVTLTLGALIAAVIVLILAVVVSRLIAYGLKRYASRYQSNESTLYTLSRVAHYTVLVAGVLVALSVAGIPFSKFAIFAGAVGVGLGFGLQQIFSNFVSGLIILFDRSLKVGDFIQLPNGVHGEVRDIHIRCTRVTTTDNIDVLIPNAKFITENVVNLTWGDPSRRIHVPFRVRYGADRDTLRKAALEAAASVRYTLTDQPARAPQLWITAFGESSIECALVVWLNADAARVYRVVMATYNWALYTALEKYGLDYPFPQRELHLKAWPAAGGTNAADAAPAEDSDPR
ncbi:MAG TPA: mechanosensitive ion channel domain-containing protein [Nevskiaceae bacterium]